MNPKEFAEELRKIMELHILLIQSNSNLLKTNLELMKENYALRRKVK